MTLGPEVRSVDDAWLLLEHLITLCRWPPGMERACQRSEVPATSRKKVSVVRDRLGGST